MGNEQEESTLATNS